MSDNLEEFNATQFFSTYMRVQQLWTEIFTNMTEKRILDLAVGSIHVTIS